MRFVRALRGSYASPMDLVDLEPGDERLERDVLPVLLELRPHLTAASFAEIYAEGHREGLRYTAAFDGGRCLGVAGWRFVSTTAFGRKLYVDDLVTTESDRSHGVGRVLLDELTRRAVEAGCSVIDLDSAVHRHDAHRFYFRERMQIAAHHFLKRIDG